MAINFNSPLTITTTNDARLTIDADVYNKDERNLPNAQAPDDRDTFLDVGITKVDVTQPKTSGQDVVNFDSDIAIFGNLIFKFLFFYTI